MSLSAKLVGSETEQTASVHYAAADDSALAGQDYTAASGDLSFAPGQRQQTVTLSIVNDDLGESMEQLKVVLTEPTNATLGTSAAADSIVDDDATAASQMSVNDVQVNECGNQTSTTSPPTAAGRTAAATASEPDTSDQATSDESTADESSSDCSCADHRHGHSHRGRFMHWGRLLMAAFRHARWRRWK